MAVVQFLTRAFETMLKGSWGKKKYLHLQKSIQAYHAVKTPDVALEPKTSQDKAKLANSVDLIGYVDQTVQFKYGSNGKIFVGTVISVHSGPIFRIPLLFEDNVAKIAVRYLKKDDRIHISGVLFKYLPPTSSSEQLFQVMVKNLNFVQPDKTISHENEEIRTKKQSASDSWKQFFESPKEWLDYRIHKANRLVKKTHPDFQRKIDGISLWLQAAPDWVLPKLEGHEFDVDALVPKIRLKQVKGKKGTSQGCGFCFMAQEGS